jgi:hypothetical protein
VYLQLNHVSLGLMPAYNNSIRALQSDLTSAKNSANAIIQKPIRTVQEVQSALTNVNRVNFEVHESNYYTQ